MHDQNAHAQIQDSDPRLEYHSGHEVIQRRWQPSQYLIIIIHLLGLAPEGWRASPDNRAPFKHIPSSQVHCALRWRPIRGSAFKKASVWIGNGKGDVGSRACPFPLEPQLYLGLLSLLDCSSWSVPSSSGPSGGPEDQQQSQAKPAAST
jgi:hypothetical protein